MDNEVIEGFVVSKIERSDKKIKDNGSDKNEFCGLMNENHDIQTKFVVGEIVYEDEVREFFDNLDSIEPEDKKFENYIIAYIDFLGVKKKMISDDNYNALQTLRFLLFGSKRVAKFISSLNGIGEFSIKIFSDNIVIAQKLNEENLGDQIISIVNLITEIQFEAFFQFAFWLRGGITIGELYIDNSVVWGSGLIEAYEIESKMANYPRVIVSDKLIDEYDCCQKKTLNLYAFINRDFDGLWYINFLLSAPSLKNVPIISETLKTIRESYKKEDNNVKQKLNWVISYFNNYCKIYKDRVENYEKYLLQLLDLKD